MLCLSSYFIDLEKKEHKCLKKSTVFILHFAPSLQFTPGPQSAFYTERFQIPQAKISRISEAGLGDLFVRFLNTSPADSPAGLF